MTAHSHHPHISHDHHHAHDHDTGSAVTARDVSLLRLSALTRCAGALCLLIPLWVSVLWVIGS
ncbi:MAG: hypothetical protein WCO61_02285 [Alphaproteobacteria bacterium]